MLFLDQSLRNFSLRTVAVSLFVHLFNNLSLLSDRIAIKNKTTRRDVLGMAEERLIKYLEKKAGEYHRGTVRYDGDSTDVLYLREDLKQIRLTSEIDRILQRLRPEASPKEERSFPFGDLKATVRLFQEAILIHFPTGTNRGIVVSLEPETARDLSTFIGECEKRIRE